MHAQPTDAMPQQFGDPKTVEITDADPNYNCCFCQRHEINPTEWGVMLKLEEIITHHFCLVRFTFAVFVKDGHNMSLFKMLRNLNLTD